MQKWSYTVVIGAKSVIWRMFIIQQNYCLINYWYWTIEKMNKKIIFFSSLFLKYEMLVDLYVQNTKMILINCHTRWNFVKICTEK